MDDERNTDNAWLENTVYNFHEEENVFSRYLLSVSNFGVVLLSFLLTLNIFHTLF